MYEAVQANAWRKSIPSLASPFSVRRMFPDLMSRCMTCLEWRYTNARTTCAQMAAICSSLSCRLRILMTSCTDPASQYSIAIWRTGEGAGAAGGRMSVEEGEGRSRRTMRGEGREGEKEKKTAAAAGGMKANRKGGDLPEDCCPFGSSRHSERQGRNRRGSRRCRSLA